MRSAAAANAATPSTGLLKIGGPFPASVKAGDFRYVILHSDRASLIPALKAANPQLKVLVYKDMAAALSWAGNTQVPAGCQHGRGRGESGLVPQGHHRQADRMV